MGRLGPTALPHFGIFDGKVLNRLIRLFLSRLIFKPAYRKVRGLCHAWHMKMEHNMSRSKRKTPITGITTARSEKLDKKLWHRAYRHAERQRLHSNRYSYPRHPFEFGAHAWNLSKDGKRYRGLGITAKLMRK